MLIEIVKERMGHIVTMSDLREATEEEIADIKSRPCDHHNQDKQLVVDECGPIYDMRSCAICGEGLGTV